MNQMHRNKLSRRPDIEGDGLFVAKRFHSRPVSNLLRAPKGGTPRVRANGLTGGPEGLQRLRRGKKTSQGDSRIDGQAHHNCKSRSTPITIYSIHFFVPSEGERLAELA